MSGEETGIPDDRLIPERGAPRDACKPVSRLSEVVVALLAVNVVLGLAATVFDLQALVLLVAPLPG